MTEIVENIENIIRNLRFSPQAFLRDNIEFFGGSGIAQRAGTATPGGNYKHFVKISNTNFDAQALQSSGTEVKKRFLSLTPLQISSLVPYIDIYKVVFSGETLKSIRIPFENYITQTNLEAITKSRTGRGGGSGILDFSWTEYFHTGPVPAIKATLKLFFQDTAALTREFKSKSGTVSPAELLKLGALGQINKNEPAPSIRISCGWSRPERELVSGAKLGGAASASVETTGITFVLSATHVDLDYGNDGTITATIDYVGLSTAALFSDKADVLSIRSDNEKKLAAKTQEKEFEKKIQKSIEADTSDGFSSQPPPEEGGAVDPSLVSSPSDAELETGTSSEKTGAVESRERSESLDKEIEVLKRAVIDEKYQKLFDYIKSTNNLFYADIPYETVDSYLKSVSEGKSISLKNVNVTGGGSSQGKMATAASSSSNQPGPEGAAASTPGAEASSGATIPTEGGTSSPPTSSEPDQSLPSPSSGPPASFPEGAKPPAGAGSTTSPPSGSAPDRAKSKQIPFTYIGAVIDAGFQGLLDSWTASGVRTNMIFRNLVGQVQFQSKGVPHWENIADIPVTIEELRNWFTKICIQSNRKSWSIGDFLKKVLQDLLRVACEPRSRGVQKTNYGIKGKLEQRQMALVGGRDSLVGASKVSEFNSTPFVNLAGKAVTRFQPGSQLGLFLFLVQDNDDAPIKKDIIKLTPGKNSGIVKSVRFSRNQSAGTRALGAAITYNALTKNENSPYVPDFEASVIGAYSAEVDMIGNSLFQLGSSESMFMLNLGGLFKSKQLNLGEVSQIEGEYKVTQVTNTIGPDYYNTTLSAQRTGASNISKKDKGKSAKSSSAKPKEAPHPNKSDE
jgi:hypothetical protein